ncbi:MAG TPA: contractile injection system protein, VgrG/Pvc8 family, partial [Deltaproteobacteria bacterium]|nr:contractile injection system protein, VgrG/Pvc8 family [Deltaproteobacteria bacterium]
MNKYTQENRIIVIETPLGADKLLLARLSGKEGISMPFSFELDLLSTDNAVVFEDIIGKDVSISIVLADGSKRHLHGIISSLTQTRGSGGGDASHQLALYKAVMVPKLWLLTRTLDSRIFQNLSVVDIVEQVL